MSRTDAVTFGPLVVKALEEKPDGIILVTHGEQAAKIIKELKSRGWKKMDHILVFSSADDAQLYATGGADLNGVQVYNYINLDISNPRWDAFKAAFAKAHNGNGPLQPLPELLRRPLHDQGSHREDRRDGRSREAG